MAFQLVLPAGQWQAAWLAFEADDHAFEQSFQGADIADGKLPLVGMRAGRTYRLATRLQSATGEIVQLEQAVLQSPELPQRLRDFPKFDVKVADPDAMEPGFTLLSLRRRAVNRMIWNTPAQRSFLRDYSLLVALDDAGEIVWYYQADFRISGIHKLLNGNLFFHTADYRSFEMDFLGIVKRVWYAARRPAGPVEGGIAIDADSMHHQPHETPDGHFLAMTANAREFDDYPSSETDADAPRKPAKVVGDKIIEFDAEGNILWSWNAFDHLDPYRVGYDTFTPFWHVRGFPDHVDWTHGNGVTIDPTDGHAMISLRNQDAFFKVSRDTGEVRWILGPHDGWGEAFQGLLLTPQGDDFRWTWHGHNPRANADGSISIYDNNIYQARPFKPAALPGQCFARGMEYVVDEGSMTVTQQWQTPDANPDDPVISWAMGDCHKLPRTGNRMVIDSCCIPQGEFLDWQKKISLSDLTWEPWDRDTWTLSDFCYWGRLREYGDGDRIVFEVHVKDPDDIVGWEMYGGSRVPSLL